jgi:hypothetical protein
MYRLRSSTTRGASSVVGNSALIAELSDFDAIQIVDLFPQQRERCVGLRAQSMIGQRLEHLGLQYRHFNA